MQGAEGEGAGSVLTYVTEPESRKQLYVPWHPYGSLGAADRLRAMSLQSRLQAPCEYKISLSRFIGISKEK